MYVYRCYSLCIYQGRATIARIRGGLLPSGLSSWPSEKVVAHNVVVL